MDGADRVRFGAGSRFHADRSPVSHLVVLLSANFDHHALTAPAQVFEVQIDQRAAPEACGIAQQDNRAVANMTRTRAREQQRADLAQVLDIQGLLLVGTLAQQALRAFEEVADLRRIGRRDLRRSVLMIDRRDIQLPGFDSEAREQHIGEIEDYCLGRRRQRTVIGYFAPGLEPLPRIEIRRARVGSLDRLQDFGAEGCELFEVGRGRHFPTLGVLKWEHKRVLRQKSTESYKLKL